MTEERTGPAALLAGVRDWWARQQLPVRLGVVGGTGASLAAVLLAVILVTGGEAAETEPTPDPTATPTTSPTPTATASATPSPSPTPVPQRDPVAAMSEDLRQFIANYGYPDDADYAVIRIPVLGAEAQVSSKYVPGGQAMPEPIGPAHVVWYDLEEYRGMGGVPGEGGNAIFSGHVDYNWYVPYAGVNYRGRGIFYDMQHMRPGDIIEVDYNGETLQYQVTWVENLSATPGATNWAEIWRSTPGVDEITVYTCGGDFNPATATYADRIVVRGERI